MSWTKGLTQVRTSAHDKRALQQLALNVHVKPVMAMVVDRLLRPALSAALDKCWKYDIRHHTVWGASHSSLVKRPLMVRCVVGSIPHGGPTELFLIPVSVSDKE